MLLYFLSLCNLLFVIFINNTLAMNNWRHPTAAEEGGGAGGLTFSVPSRITVERELAGCNSEEVDTDSVLSGMHGK